MKKEYICIACPVGCHLVLEEKSKDDIKVTGNRCSRGESYAREEYSEPKRTVTATCSADNGRIPVKTNRPILKEHIDSLLKEIYSINIDTLVERGDVIIKNYADTGVDVVATGSSAGKIKS
ncbi:MAG: DUF1667 domain-containing protein [Spirochaetes bacterium]|nr:DUF1667 domain-containing protein [Spirochaetota bacterium]